jgi:hypothetical protein
MLKTETYAVAVHRLSLSKPLQGVERSDLGRGYVPWVTQHLKVKGIVMGLD